MPAESSPQKENWNLVSKSRGTRPSIQRYAPRVASPSFAMMMESEFDALLEAVSNLAVKSDSEMRTNESCLFPLCC